MFDSHVCLRNVEIRLQKRGKKGEGDWVLDGFPVGICLLLDERQMVVPLSAGLKSLPSLPRFNFPILAPEIICISFHSWLLSNRFVQHSLKAITF